MLRYKNSLLERILLEKGIADATCFPPSGQSSRTQVSMSRRNWPLRAVRTYGHIVCLPSRVRHRRCKRQCSIDSSKPDIDLPWPLLFRQ
jgi:hypothetical protein